MNNMLIEIVLTVKQQGNPFILKYSIVIIFSLFYLRNGAYMTQ